MGSRSTRFNRWGAPPPIDSEAIALTTHGDVVFRAAAVLDRLAPGVAGQFLQTAGPAANPLWADVLGIDSGTLAARPAAGNVDTYYWATDVQILFRDTGAAWEIVSAGINYGKIITDSITKKTVETMTNFNCAADRVYLSPIEIPCTCTIDALIHGIGSACAGNTRKGLYYDNGSTPVGGALIVEVGPQTTIPTWTIYTDTIADTRLAPGLYWIGLEFSDVSQPEYKRMGFAGTAPNDLFDCYYDLGGFLAFSDPCPAITKNSGPVQSLRIKSIP